jgi:hypothetical protein
MSDMRALLERVGERVSAAPDALERVARRKGRRQRNRRLLAAVVAVAVSMAGVGGVFVAFGGSNPRPAGSAGVVHIRLDGPPQPIAADDQAAWTVVGTSDSDNVLWRIDAETNEAVPLENTRGAEWPAVGEGFAWVTVCQGSGSDGCGQPSVLKLDPVTGVTLATIALPAYPWQIGVGFGSVWVSTAEGLVRIDASSGRVLGTVPGRFDLLAMAGGWIWASSEPRAIVRIDPSSSEVVGTTSVPDPCVMVSAAGSIWTATCGGIGADKSGDVLTRLDGEDGSVVGRTKLGHWGHLVGSDDGLWLVRPADDGRSDVILSIDVATGAPVDPGYVLPLPDEVRFSVIGTFQWTPFGAVAAGWLWITDLGTGSVLRVPLDKLASLERPATTSPSPSPETSPAGYFVQLPEELMRAPDNPNGGGTLVATTNLPEGAIVSVVGYEILDSNGEPSGGFGSIGGLKVKDGQIRAHLDNQSCYYLVGQQGTSAGVSVTVTVSPEGAHPISVPMGSESVDTSQPLSVMRILGEDFEHLRGEQVKTVDGVRELIATRTYAWPQDSCAGTRKAFVPQICPPAQGQLQGDNLKEAMGEVMGAIAQGRLCDLWQLALTPEVEAQHPWSEFRQEWSDWLFERLGDVTEPGDPYSSALTWEVVAEETVGDQTSFSVAVALRGDPVAGLVMVSLPDSTAASQPGVIPFWGLVSYTLGGE